MNNLNLMAELVRQYGAVYSERQKVMRAKREMVYNKHNKHTQQEWYRAMVDDGIIPNSTVNRYFFTYSAVEVNGRAVQRATYHYRSAASKRAAIADFTKRQAQWEEHYKSLPESTQQHIAHTLTTPKEDAAQLAKLHSREVHPHAKNICAYGKLVARLKVLDTKKQQLGHTIKQLSKMELGVKVKFGTMGYYACDRITLVAVGERTMKPKEFLELVEFESAVFGES